MDYLARTRGITRFILYGLCSGADASYFTALLDVTAGTSKSQLHKARLKLRKLLKTKAYPRLVGMWRG